MSLERRIIDESEISDLKNKNMELESVVSWQDEDIDNMKSKIDTLENERDDFKNKWLYALADSENIRKRLNERISNIQRYKEEDIIKDLINTYVYFDKSLEYNNDEGIVFVYNAFKDVLNKYEFVETKINNGDMFDENLMEAVSIVPTDDKSKDMTINSVMNHIYLYKDKIIKYGKVIVNKFTENE